MNHYRAYSTATLVQFHNSIFDALIADLCVWHDPIGFYGVRAFSDWADMRDVIEDELRLRGVAFQPITWW
jgi:hypothetical protein